MIQSRLHKLFDAYIENFEKINSEGNPEKGWGNHREYFKWIAAQAFKTFDFDDLKDYVSRLKELNTQCSVIIDSSSHYPFNALIKCAEKEGPEGVRDLFLHLFEDDGGDLKFRQARIDAFIRDSNAMVKRNGLLGHVYENNQTSAMAFLALRDPEHNCLLKTSYAKRFASRVGFADDWGTLNNFKLDVYYRFCDEIASFALAHDVKDKHRKRFEKEFADEHGVDYPIFQLEDDNDKYLLVFDIIYCAEYYGFADGCPIDPELERKIQPALFYRDQLHKVEEEMAQVEEAEAYWKRNLMPGLGVIHAMFGNGRVEKVEEKGQYTLIQAAFPESHKTMVFCLEDPKLVGHLSFQIPDYNENGLKYHSLLSKKATAEKRLKEAQLAFEPYRDYVD